MAKFDQFRRTLQLLGVTSVPELRRYADTLVVCRCRPEAAEPGDGRGTAMTPAQDHR